MPNPEPSHYFLIDAEHPKRMLLGSLPDPGLDDSWTWGQPFSEKPKTPVLVRIIPGYEQAEPLPYFGTPPLMTNEFHQALVKAGVDNLDVYDAAIVSVDRKIRLEGFKAFNLIGLVKAANPEKTRFSSENDSRLLDASIDALTIDGAKAKGLLMFRLAEYSGAIVVHESIKRAIEAAGFPYVVFREPESFIS